MLVVSIVVLLLHGYDYLLGLDASTALEWAKALRAMTGVLGLSTIVTLYQAGNGIYNLFDKVLVLDEGKQIYYGPAAAAKPFMEDLGFER